MKRLFFLNLLILCFSMVPTQAQQINLPKKCQKILNQKHPGWKIAEISPEILDWFQKSKQSYQPNLIKGDWNGDGKTDYALLIQKAKFRKNEPGVFLIAFVKNASSYSFHQLEGYDYIMLMKKGEKDYDFETDKTFVYKNDAIFAGIFEKAGTSFVWRKGRFIAILTSD